MSKNNGKIQRIPWGPGKIPGSSPNTWISSLFWHLNSQVLLWHLQWLSLCLTSIRRSIKMRGINEISQSQQGWLIPGEMLGKSCVCSSALSLHLAPISVSAGAASRSSCEQEWDALMRQELLCISCSCWFLCSLLWALKVKWEWSSCWIRDMLSLACIRL